MRGQLGRLPPLSEAAATVRSRGPTGRASIRAADDVLEADLQSDEILACFEEALRLHMKNPERSVLAPSACASAFSGALYTSARNPSGRASSQTLLQSSSGNVGKSYMGDSQKPVSSPPPGMYVRATYTEKVCKPIDPRNRKAGKKPRIGGGLPALG